MHACSEKAMAPHSSTLAWKIPWMEEPGRLQSMGSLRVGHDWVTSLSLFTFLHWRRKWQPTPVFLPGESQGRQSLVGCRLWGRTESDTTEQLSSSSSSMHAKSLQSCSTLCHSMDCRLPGSFAYGILQVRILELVAMPSSRGSSMTQELNPSLSSPALPGELFTTRTPRKPYMCI